MRIFHKEEPWSGKINFVDENNVILGYDTYNDCCSHGGWFISTSPEEWLTEEDQFKMEPMELPGWTFDVSYFRDRENYDELESGGAVQYRIVNGDEEKFITLFNCHNGYYGKGFEFVCPVDTTKNREDTL